MPIQICNQMNLETPPTFHTTNIATLSMFGYPEKLRSNNSIGAVVAAGFVAGYLLKRFWRSRATFFQCSHTSHTTCLALPDELKLITRALDACETNLARAKRRSRERTSPASTLAKKGVKLEGKVSCPDSAGTLKSRPSEAQKPKIPPTPTGAGGQQELELCSFAGPYATLGELLPRATSATRRGKQLANDDKQREKPLSAVQELDQMENFSYVISLPYFHARDLVKKKGYDLHVLYVTTSSTLHPAKTPALRYSHKIIGVHLDDPKYNHHTKQPSAEATIAAVIDIGGQDRSNRGV